ncbi:MAG TPA: KH domain-containing protein [Actinomycetota bacterium]|nr:KH domain-containing protein [Actinomycetota bacterium]
MRELLEFIAKELVEDPDAVAVTEVTDDRGLLLQLSVGREDMGRVIGRGGRTARAIRLVMKAAAVRDGTHVAVEILD